MEQEFARSDEAVFLAAAVFGAGEVVERVSEAADAVEVIVVVLGVLGVPDGSEPPLPEMMPP